MNNRKQKIDKDSRFKQVHSVWGPVEAEVVKSYLKSHGISCFFRGLVVQSVHAFSMDGLGEIKIFVKEKDYDLAIKLLEEKLFTK